MSQLQNSDTQQNRPFEAVCAPSFSPTHEGLGSSEGTGQPRLPSQTASKSSIFLGIGVLQLARMKKIAYLFPGQGAQYVGMGKDFAQTFAIARQTFEEASEILKENLSKVIFEGPEELLSETKYSQLGIFVTSAAILRTLVHQIPELKPFVCSGLSLGEYTALYASGRLGFDEVLHLVHDRARFMQEACLNTCGSMSVVLGLSAGDVEAAVMGLKDVWVANYNGPGQTVISGTDRGIARALPLLKERGAKRLLSLNVQGAFHSGLMQSAQEELAPSIAAAAIRNSAIRLVMNVPGNFVETTDEIREYLTAQVTQSVRWEQGIGAMQAKGVELYLEIGCGKTLAGMNKKIGVGAPTLSIDKVVDLDEVARKMGVLCSC